MIELLSTVYSKAAIYSLSNIGAHHLYTSLNCSLVIVAAADLLATTKKGRS